jgi:hypothetical protein
MITNGDLWRAWRRMCAALACAGVVKIEAGVRPWNGTYAHVVRGWLPRDRAKGREPEWHWTRPVSFLPGEDEAYDRYIAVYAADEIEAFHEAQL